MRKNDSRSAVVRRHLRLRKHISGTAQRPRLNVFRSLNNIYAQVIDDEAKVTLVSASTLDKEIKESIPSYSIAAATFITAEYRHLLKVLVKPA